MMRVAWGWSVDVKLLRRESLLGLANEGGGVVDGPEVYVEGVEAEEVLALVARVSRWEPPVVFAGLNWRSTFKSVDYHRDQSRVLV